jgi:trigger factor
LEVQVQETGVWTRELSITVPVETVEQEMDRIVGEYRRRAALPGFRKGKAPNELIQRQFHGDIESDLLDRLIPDAYRDALKETGLIPASRAKIRNIRFEKGEALHFLAEVEITPDITVTGFRGLEVEQDIVEVDDQMIAEAIEALRTGRAERIPVDRPSQPGDVIEAVLEPVDVRGKKLPSGKREEVRMDAGSSTLLPEFREASLGISKGESRMVEVTYPADVRDRELAGKTRRFRMTAREIQEKKLPEPDDNFARSVDSNLDFEGLKAKLRLRFESEELMRSRQRLEERVIDQLLDANPFTVPDGMVEERTERAIERAREDSPDVDEEAFRGRLRPLIERVCRRDVLLDTLVRQESLAVTDEELDAELETMAQEAGVDIEVIRKKMEDDGDMPRLRDMLQERKTIDFLIGGARVNRVRRPRVRENAGAALADPD